MATTQKNDFIVVERSGRPQLDSMYRFIAFRGSTYDEEGLIDMATRMGLGGNEIPDVESAVKRIEQGGWIVLKFMN